MPAIAPQIETIIGNQIKPYIDSIAQFRMNAFKEFPYLYQGNVEDEQKYLASYANNPQATLIVAKLNSKIVGIVTGIPLICDVVFLKNISAELIKKSYDPMRFYYCGEIIIAENYRDQGIAIKLYTQQKEQLKKWEYTYLCALTVKRSVNHPLRPKRYVDIKKFLDKADYKKFDFEILLHWPTILSSGKVKNIKNKLTLWVNKIA